MTTLKALLTLRMIVRMLIGAQDTKKMTELMISRMFVLFLLLIFLISVCELQLFIILCAEVLDTQTMQVYDPATTMQGRMNCTSMLVQT